MIRKINNIAFLLVLVMFTTALTFAQTPSPENDLKQTRAELIESKADVDQPIIPGSIPNSQTQTEASFLPQHRSDPSPAEATQGRGRPLNKNPRMRQPDLRIRQFLFPPTNDKALRVQVVNAGQSPSGGCRLVITVRKINGVAVGRQTHVNVPALAAGADVWLHIDVKSILPNNISLQSTTFKLNVDATGLVAESDESNNEVWHNL